MPEFEASVDVDPYDFVDTCDAKEIKTLIEYLIEEHHIPNISISQTDVKQITYDQEEYYTLISKLSGCYLRISPEDIDVLRMIAKKY